MIAAVLLAGGEARRLGQSKGLVMVRGQRLLERQLEALAAAGVRDVGLSLGANRPSYVEVWPYLENDVADITTSGGPITVHVVVDRRSRFGPFGSLLAGIEALAAERWQRLLIAPIDIPIVAAVIDALVAVSADAVVPRYLGRGGHPVLLSRTLAMRLLTLDPATGRLDVVLRELPSQSRADIVVTTPEVVVDLNTADAVTEWLKAT